MRKKSFLDYVRDIYVYLYDAKMTMGLYFSTYIMVYIIIASIDAKELLGLEFWTGVEMLGLSVIVGFIQPILVPRYNYSNRRSIIWVTISSVASIAAIYIFNWFEGMSKWCEIVYIVFFILGTLLMWLGFYWIAETETKELNESLRLFKKKAFKEAERVERK